MIKCLRIRARYLQTPERVYQDPATGRRVTVVCASHIGDPRYYRNLQRTLDAAAARGAVVQYECVMEDGADALAGATTEECGVVDGMGAIPDAFERFAALCGWTVQDLEYRPGWENVDITELDIVQLSGITNVAERLNLPPEELEAIGGDRWTSLIALLMMPVILRSYNRLIPLALPENLRKVIIDHRNQTALAGVFRALPERDVVIIWGAGHLPGLDQGLQERGLRLVSRRWRTVGRLPRILPAIYRLVRQPADAAA